jgi:hypothetical protein
MTTSMDERAGLAGAESGTEVLTDGILLIFKFMESHLNEEELRFYKDLKPGEYVPLESLRPIWDALAERIPTEMKAAIKGMVFRTRGILAETGAQTPGDAVRASNVLYQAFVRGPRIGGVEVLTEAENEAVTNDLTWVRCPSGGWFFEAVLRAYGARAVRIEHLNPCQRKGERYCRLRGRWSGVKRPG